MAGAKGKSQRFEPVNVAGLDTRVWQAEGTSTDAVGVVFTLRGEVAKVKGIVPLVDWSEDPFAPFSVNGAFGLSQVHHHGTTEILVHYDDKIAVLEAGTLTTLFTGKRSASRPREGIRTAQYADMLAFFDGQTQNVRWDGHIPAPLGIHAPPPHLGLHLINEAAAVELSSLFAMKHNATATSHVTYSYVQTYINDRGQESEPSVVASISDDDALADALYNVAVISDCTPTDPNVIARQFYRATDARTFLLLRRLNGVKSRTWYDYTDAGSEPTLNTLAASGDNAAPPVARWGFVFRGRMYFGGVEDTPSFLYYSNLDAPESAATRNVIDVSSSDGDVVVGWSVAQDFALVFKRNAVFLLTHDRNEDPILTPVVRGVGAISDKAIVPFDGKVYFLSDDGFFVTDGNKVTHLSAALDDWVRLLPQAHLEDAFGWVDQAGRRVMLSVNAGGSEHNDEVWAIHIDTGAITRLSGFILGAAMNYKRETLVIFRHDPGGGEEWDLGLWGASDTIDETAYTGRWDTRWLEFKKPHTDKAFSHVIVYYTQDGSHELSVDWATSWDDRSASGSSTVRLSDSDAPVWGTGVWGTARDWDGPRRRSARVDITDDVHQEVIGKSIRFSFGTTAKNTPFHIAGFEVFYRDHGNRQDGTDATF